MTRVRSCLAFWIRRARELGVTVASPAPRPSPSGRTIRRRWRTPAGPGPWIFAVVAGLGIAGCATPKPILYPNAHLQQVGPEAAERDTAECRHLAESAGATVTAEGGQVAGSAVMGGAVGAAAGAVGGAIVGAAGSGALAGGVAGIVGGILNAVIS